MCLVSRAGFEPAQALRAGLSVLQEAVLYWATPPPGTRTSVAIYRFLYREQKFGGCVGNRTPAVPALVGSFALMLLRLLTVHVRSS